MKRILTAIVILIAIMVPVPRESSEADMPQAIVIEYELSDAEKYFQMYSSVQDQINDYEVELLANVAWGEAHICPTITERAAVMWCCLNRVDQLYGDLEYVITSGQFDGYQLDNPILDDYTALARDVLSRWMIEKEYGVSSGRVLPAEFIFFCGDGVHNYFTIGYPEGSIEYCYNNAYTWWLESPYDLI